MKTVLLTGHGGPEKLEYREDVPVPRPDEDEVLIEVGAAGTNGDSPPWSRAYRVRTLPDGSSGLATGFRRPG